jgi:hypothetical protein
VFKKKGKGEWVVRYNKKLPNQNKKFKKIKTAQWQQQQHSSSSSKQ